MPDGYGSHFRSRDGKQRSLLVEGAGGPSWYTEFNVFTGLSARSFGRFAYFVTRIAAGRSRSAALRKASIISRGASVRQAFQPDTVGKSGRKA